MAITQWLPKQSRNGTLQTPAFAIPANATGIYLQIDDVVSFSDPATAIDITAEVSYDGGVTWRPGSGAHLVGGGSTPPGKTLVHAVVVNVPGPPRPTHVRAAYTVVNGPITFGVSGELLT